MKDKILRQKQKILHGDSEENGDCFRTAMANLLCMHTCAVPHFYRKENSPEEAIEECREWLGTQGYSLVEIYWHPDVANMLKDTYHILSGVSPRYHTAYHAVVGYEGEPYFDPHPDERMIEGDKDDWIMSLVIPKSFHDCP